MTALTVFSDTHTFEASQRMAKALCSSTLVPEHFRTEKNLGNALIALELAQRMDLSPMAVLQNLYVVHGRPGWSAQFLIASFNSSGKFSPISYEQVGEPGKPSFGFIAKATVLATGEEIRGPAVTMETAERDGWAKRNDKYRSMPELMLRYRAATWFVRLVAPELSMGLQTKEELEDMPREERNITPRPDLNAELKRVVIESEPVKSPMPTTDEMIHEFQTAITNAETEADLDEIAWSLSKHQKLEIAAKIPPKVVHVLEKKIADRRIMVSSIEQEDQEPEVIESEAPRQPQKIDRAWFRKMISEAETDEDLNEIEEVLESMKDEIPVAGFNAVVKVLAEKREKFAG